MPSFYTFRAVESSTFDHDSFTSVDNGFKNMDTPLLTTKHYIPRPSSNLVKRPHLVERLSNGLQQDCLLTLISAPAGFGKTTLLSEWISVCNHPVAWISLDEGDNDLARFMAYLIAALRSINPRVGDGVLEILQVPQPSSPEAHITTLINQINVVIHNRFILILDDYHLITAAPVVKAIGFLLDHLPSQMHLVIASRIDPALPIARLRARGQLTELRQTDLCFTLQETTTFLNQAMGLNLSVENIAALNTRTEGWIAGLQMAALAMRSTVSGSTEKEVTSFVQDFTGSNRFVLDYLIEEVFQHQQKDIEIFILKTSILDQLTAPLCNAVTGEENGQAMLEKLERANLFIVPLDSKRKWYRYHRFFADLLRHRLQQSLPDIIPELHRRASEWYKHNDFITEAIDHALAAGRTDQAAHLIEEAAESIMLRSEVSTLQRWLGALPGETIRTRPLLCVYHALTLILSGSPPKNIETRLQDAMESDVNGSVCGEVAALRAWIATHQGKKHQYLELSRQALELLPQESRFFRSIATGFIGLDSLYGGDVETFNDIARMGQETGDLTMAVLTQFHKADLTKVQGKLFKAQTFYEQALALATASSGHKQPIAGLAMIGLGRLQKEWNNLEIAARYLTEGIELAQAWSETSVGQGCVELAFVKLALGDVEGAREALKVARRLTGAPNTIQANFPNLAVYEVRLELARGDIAAAAQHAAAYDLDDCIHLEELENTNSEPFSLLPKLDLYATLAWLHIAQNKPNEALRMLTPLIQTTEVNGWTESVIETLILQALALQSKNNVPQALGMLERALFLAESEAYVRPFIEKGEPMACLLRRAADKGISVNYVSRLLVVSNRKPINQQSDTLIEPISKRELEVLRLLAAGHANKEIGEILVVAVGTVKKHIKNIFRKLAVHSRTQAIARAQELDLL